MRSILIRHIFETKSILYPEVFNKINWSALSMNRNITWYIVIENIHQPWNWSFLSQNHNITWDIVKNNINMPWIWESLSINPNITWEIIKNNLNYKWDWFYLSLNKNITLTIVNNNLDMPWDLCNVINKCNDNNNTTCISKSKNDVDYDSLEGNITWDLLKKNIEEPWNWYNLSQNDNFICSEDEMAKLYLCNKSAKCIQRYFQEANLNPYYLLCKKRLMYEFNEMT